MDARSAGGHTAAAAAAVFLLSYALNDFPITSFWAALERGLAGPLGPQSARFARNLGALVVTAAANVAIAWAAIKGLGLTEDEVGWSRPKSWRPVALGVGVAFALFSLEALVVRLWSDWVAHGPPTRVWLGATPHLAWAWQPGVFAHLSLTWLATAIPEELVFRGVLLAALSRVMDRRGACVAAAALFAMSHLHMDDPRWPMLDTAVRCISGLAYGLLFQRYGSLSVPMAAHATTNACAYWLVWYADFGSKAQ